MFPAPALFGTTENVPASVDPLHGDGDADEPPPASASPVTAATRRISRERAVTGSL
jgi:hypothetical protein